MRIFKEQHSLVLEQKTLVKNGELYEGTFVPINPMTINWIEPLIKFLKEANSIAVEVGPTDKARAIADFKNGVFTRSEFVGLLIMAPMDIDEKLLRFKFTMLPHGSRKGEIIERLESRQPFIISAKTLVDHHLHNGDSYQLATQVIGLENLTQEELEMSVPAETLEQTAVAKVPVNTVIQIKEEQYLADDIILGNDDIASVVKLNLAAGNFIDHQSPETTPEQYESQIKRQLGVDLNECFELLEAYITGDTSLLRDALADKRITLNGFQTILPFSLIDDYRGAVKNNFTRFDSTYERALETQEKYAKLEVPTVINLVELEGPNGQATEYFVNKVAEDCTATTGEVFTKGKWVKSKYFTNDAFEEVDGLFAGQDNLDDNVAAVTRRYTESYKLCRRLLRALGKAYTDKIRDLTEVSEEA